ncbi:MAG: hypothetical protein KBC24_04235 [Caldisericia bacterium]|nr:hypothetical protein [Caldisericia bacterium]
MTPYREILLQAKDALEMKFPGVEVVLGPRQLAKQFPCLALSIAPSEGRATTIGGGRESIIGLTISVLSRDYQGREQGYLALADIISRIEEEATEPTFLPSYLVRHVETNFSLEPFYHENQFVLQGAVGLQVEVEN